MKNILDWLRYTPVGKTVAAALITFLAALVGYTLPGTLSSPSEPAGANVEWRPMPDIDQAKLENAVLAVLGTRAPELDNVDLLLVTPLDRYSFGIAVYVRWTAIGALGQRHLGEEVIVFGEDAQPKQFLTVTEYFSARAHLTAPRTSDILKPQ